MNTPKMTKGSAISFLCFTDFPYKILAHIMSHTQHKPKIKERGPSFSSPVSTINMVFSVLKINATKIYKKKSGFFFR